ncbi:STAS/SEC14 domain-containing protein [Segetibacter koreensis]|uniref:STAS/SEC14 domain-containing protein n=1 Tax=Segetibacter koreensis TaxID=398037 RepID=UPI00037AAECC|nr:STAS/SEC14 domain-containing protein [Segetibacter koreensis]
MLQLIKDLPQHVVGVRAVGHVGKEDYEQTFMPAIEKVANEFGEINLLMLLETEITNFSYGAWMRDAKVSLKHFAQWHKVAIVTDQKVIERISHILSFLSPAEVKGFPVSDAELAKVWVAAPKEKEKKHNA